MASPLTDQDVLRIAALARLELSAEEVERFTRQLGDILAYATEVQNADTTGVPPTSHPLSAGAAWRDDAPVPSLDRSLILQQAASASVRAGLFKVPKVL
jgi:aspartyl-tRNA(Asn)/glutamyl-tRNA(Gln) amidotransferase subunit C